MFNSQPNARAIFSGISLALIAVLCTAGVLYVQADTEEHIQANRVRYEQELVNKMLPNAQKEATGKITYRCKLISDKLIGKNMRAYIAQDDTGKVLGYISNYSTNRGYSNPLIMIGAVDSNMRISKIDFMVSKETPGIGDKLDRKKGTYLDMYDNLSIDDAKWDVKKFGGDFDYITGATVTSRAVALATHDFLKAMQKIDFESLKDCKPSN